MSDLLEREQSDFSQKFTKRAALLLSVALFLLLGHAFVPFDEFIHRGDDAYYFFKVATNWPVYRFWTFDGLNPTNGVQPLWGVLLSATAQVLAWCGMTDLDVTARIFVFQTALLHFISCMLLFRLLRRHVSLGVAIGAAGGLLFPLGIVWTHVWGMENSLYCVLLLLTVLFYHERFRERGTTRNAVLLGLLLGLTALSRLNAGILIPVLLSFYLASGRHGSILNRIRQSSVIGAAASLLILPYFALNYFSTGHMLPVSGGAKAIRAKVFLEAHDIESIFSAQFFDVLLDYIEKPTEWFVSSRGMDGTWLAGGRLWNFDAMDYGVLRWTLLGFLVLPFLTLRPLGWLRALGSTFRRLGPFGYVLVYALLNAIISVSLYPFEVSYSIKRWWLAEGEIVITTLVATVIATSIGYVGVRWIPKQLAVRVATGLLGLLVALSARNTIAYYWDGETQYPDWNWSLNDQRYLASEWINEHLTEEDIVGSWNAGVIGYYAKAHVVNLDGLINNWDFLSYLERDALAEYIRKAGIGYLMDTNYELMGRGGLGLEGQLNLEPIHHRSMDIGLGLDYRQSIFLTMKVPGAPKPGE